MNLPTFTLLIVEDFLADRELYRRSLIQDSSCVYQVLEAESVAAGLELCNTQSIDAILLDYALPDGDGLEFLTALAAQSDRSIPPVVMMTGQGDESIAVRALELGAQDYLVKRNVSPQLLRLKIRSAILHRRGSANEHARLQRQVQQGEARFRVAIDNLPECLGIYSAIRSESGQIIDFRFDYLNAAALASNQMSVDDIGKRLCEVFPAVRETGLFAEYCQVVETATPLFAEDLRYVNIFDRQQLATAYRVHIGKLDDGFVASWRDVTAQKQAELALQSTTQQITDIWESMTDAYVTLVGVASPLENRDWRIIYANQAATTVVYQLVGLTPAEFLGKTYWEVFPWSVGNFVEREYRRAMTERVAVNFDVLYEPTGSWFEVHAYPATAGLGLYFRDINERKQLEAERLAAERERDRFFNLSIDLLAVSSSEGYFTRLNPAWEKMLGFTLMELMAQPFVDFVHPDDRTQTIAAAGSLSQGELVVNFENRYRCKDGSYRWLLWSAIAHAELNVWYAIGHDITKRKQAEALIRDSESKFSAIFNQTFELIGLLSLDGVVREVNQTALASVSALQTDIVGQNVWDTPWWKHSPQLQHQLKDAIVTAASGQLIRYEMQFPNASGALMAIDFSLKPVFDESGRVMMLLAEGHDITERNQIQSALEQRNHELDSFGYIVSHDLKAPLRAIANLSKWIEEDLAGSLSVHNQEQMTLLRSRVNRMGATIDGLLDYARVGQTNETIELVPVAQLLAEVIDSLAPPSTLTISVTPNLPTLHTNRIFLFQVFANPIGNAIEHHHRSDGLVGVACQERGDWYEFAVSDDGPGIGLEHHDQIFTIFQAIDPQNRADSTGIGLAIVKKIIEAQRGTIWLESQLGKGTTFYFTWPKQS